jgi:hypothetical protein
MVRTLGAQQLRAAARPRQSWHPVHEGRAPRDLICRGSQRRRWVILENSLGVMSSACVLAYAQFRARNLHPVIRRCGGLGKLVRFDLDAERAPRGRSNCAVDLQVCSLLKELQRAQSLLPGGRGLAARVTQVKRSACGELRREIHRHAAAIHSVFGPIAVTAQREP